MTMTASLAGGGIGLASGAFFARRAPLGPRHRSPVEKRAEPNAVEDRSQEVRQAQVGYPDAGRGRRREETDALRRDAQAVPDAEDVHGVDEAEQARNDAQRPKERERVGGAEDGREGGAAILALAGAAMTFAALAATSPSAEFDDARTTLTPGRGFDDGSDERRRRRRARTICRHARRRASSILGDSRRTRVGPGPRGRSRASRATEREGVGARERPRVFGYGGERPAWSDP